MDLDEAIDLAGGSIGLDEAEPYVTRAGVRALAEALDVFGSAANQAVARGAVDGLHVAITLSTSMDSRVRLLDDGLAVILIPIGVLVRARSLARRLHWYLRQNQPFIHMVGSTMDERDFPWELAPGLVPVFGEVASHEPERYWDELAAFDARTPPAEAGDVLAVDVMAHCFLHLALHELAHLDARHDLLLELGCADNDRVERALSPDRLRRGIELHADYLAGTQQTSLLLRRARKQRHSGRRLGRLFYRLSFAATMLFGMYDTHRKTVYEYDNGSYQHPVLRYEFWNEWMKASVLNAGPRYLKAAQRFSLEGWQDCVRALNALEFDCMRAAYGRPPESSPGGTGRYVPVTALKYSAASALRYRAQDDLDLLETVVGLGADSGR